MFTWTYKKLITLRVFPNNKIVFFLTHPTCTIFPFLKCRLFSGDSVECNMGVPVTRHIFLSLKQSTLFQQNQKEEELESMYIWYLQEWLFKSLCDLIKWLYFFFFPKAFPPPISTLPYSIYRFGNIYVVYR